MEIIVDLFNQHSGDMKELKRMALAAWLAGADTVKIQLLNSKKIWGDDSRQYMEMTREHVEGFADFCAKHNIQWMATPFEYEHISWLEAVGVKRYKISSWSVKNDVELCRAVIEYAAKNTLSMFNIPRQVIISLGLVDEFLFGMRENIHYMYCSSEYPTLLDSEKLRQMPKQFSNGSNWHGYSDHSVGIAAALEAYRRGAQTIEKHFTMNQALQCSTEKAHLGSFTPESLRTFKEIVMQYELINFK